MCVQLVSYNNVHSSQKINIPLHSSPKLVQHTAYGGFRDYYSFIYSLPRPNKNLTLFTACLQLIIVSVQTNEDLNLFCSSPSSYIRHCSSPPLVYKICIHD